MSMRVLFWARPVSALNLPACAVVATSGGSRVTACNGRWSVGEREEIWPGVVPPTETRHCGGCVEALA